MGRSSVIAAPPGPSATREITVIERPPEGPARGAVPAPAWLVWIAASALLALSLWALSRAWRRSRK